MSLRDWPIKQKLTAMLLLISGLVLLLTAAAFVTYEVVAFRQMTLKDLSTLGRIIAANSTASLAFANEADAREILSALRAEPHVVAAGLYDKDGRVYRPAATTCGSALRDRKSTRLNSSHSQISYAVFCLKKKKKRTQDNM